MNIQWYPGHMTKARRAMQEDIKRVDLVIEVTDARIPYSSRNPDIDQMGKNKARLILLNKADLADEVWNEAWTGWFKGQGYQVVKINSRTGAGLKQIQAAVQEACREKLERDRKRGMQNRPIRAMVAGIPNVGKSTFINAFAGKACAKTGNKPGVTKGNQWIRLNKNLELLDTPGILWPRFDDQEVGKRLAFIGSINDEILNREELALEFIGFMMRQYPGALRERYGEPEAAEKENEQEEMPGLNRYEKELAVLQQIARVRGCLAKGNQYDLSRAANLFLDDYRSGRLGRMTLEFPPETGAKQKTEKRQAAGKEQA